MQLLWWPLQLSVIGTPAEEGGGGKIVLANAGAFDDVDLALMAHPFNVNISRPNVSAACMWVMRPEFSKSSHYSWE